MKKIFIISLIFSLNACVTLLDEFGHPGSFSPKPLFLRNIPQDESNYSTGFRDGCYNIIGQTGYGMSRYYDRPANPYHELLDDPLYHKGYRSGDRHCSVYVNKSIIL